MLARQGSKQQRWSNPNVLNTILAKHCSCISNVHSSLAHIFSLQHANESLWGILQTISHMVQIADLALLQPLQKQIKEIKSFPVHWGNRQLKHSETMTLDVCNEMAVTTTN